MSTTQAGGVANNSNLVNNGGAGTGQNNNNSGDVTVTIKRDGSVFETATSSGAYVIATASGSIPKDE